MSELMWIRSHVERCLQQVWQTPELVVDDDGDHPFRRGTAAGWVRVLPDEPHMVRVFAHAVTGVRRTARLLVELNEIQGEALAGAVLWSDGLVIVQQTVPPHGLTPQALGASLRAVGGLAAHIGPLLASVHGGDTPFPLPSGVDEEVA